MTAEAIIKQIQQDADNEISKIKKEIQEKINEIQNEIQEKTKKQVKEILERGSDECENIKRIKFSQAQQEAKREFMNEKENIIEDCFTEAKQKISDLNEEKYRKIVSKLINQGSKQISGSFAIKTSKDIDKEIAKEKNLSVEDSIQASGGIQLIAKENGMTIDNTFEGILKRKKDKIRVKVGKLLFS